MSNEAKLTKVYVAEVHVAIDKRAEIMHAVLSGNEEVLKDIKFRIYPRELTCRVTKFRDILRHGTIDSIETHRIEFTVTGSEENPPKTPAAIAALYALNQSMATDSNFRYHIKTNGNRQTINALNPAHHVSTAVNSLDLASTDKSIVKAAHKSKPMLFAAAKTSLNIAKEISHTTAPTFVGA